MQLVLDVGNSAIKGAFVNGPVLSDAFRVPLSGSYEGWEVELRRCLDGRPLTRAGLVSVVPTVTRPLRHLLERLTGVEPVVVDHRMRLPFSLAYRTPETLGTDRLAAAAGAWVQFGRAADGSPRSVVALDAGTAVTCEVIDRTGVFRGGTIGAGPGLVRDALNRGTAQLPAISLELPSTVIGHSTREALQAGILLAFLDGIRGLLTRIADELDDRLFVVATGGWGPFLHEHLDAVHHLAPHLVLEGVRVLVGLQEKE